jgi:hypothetical protein
LWAAVSILLARFPARDTLIALRSKNQAFHVHGLEAGMLVIRLQKSCWDEDPNAPVVAKEFNALNEELLKGLETE